MAVSDNLQLDPDFTYETHRQGGEAFVSNTVGAGTAITSFNGLSGPSVSLAGGSTGYSFAPSGTTLTMTGASASIKESAGPTTLSIGAVADGQYLRRSGSSIVGASASAVGRAVTTVSSNTTLSADSSPRIILVDTDSGAVTVTLPSAATAQEITFKNIGTSGNLATLDGNGAQTIDGLTTVDLADGDSVTLASVTATTEWQSV